MTVSNGILSELIESDILTLSRLKKKSLFATTKMLKLWDIDEKRVRGLGFTIARGTTWRVDDVVNTTAEIRGDIR